MSTVFQNIVKDTIPAVALSSTNNDVWPSSRILKRVDGEWILHATLSNFDDITTISGINGVDSTAAFNGLADTNHRVCIVTSYIGSGITKIDASTSAAIGSSSAGQVWQCDGTDWNNAGNLEDIVHGTMGEIYVPPSSATELPGSGPPHYVRDNDVLITTRFLIRPSINRINKDDQCRGFAIAFNRPQPTINVNRNLLFSVEVEKAHAFGTSTTKPNGILLEYHHKQSLTIGRKGRFIVATTETYDASTHIGQKITAARYPGKVVATTNASDGVGQIVGGGVHTVIGNHFIVDLNLPE